MEKTTQVSLVKYSIVLPLIVFDKAFQLSNGYLLFKNIGLPSYRKFLDCKDLDKFYIISPRREIPYVKELIQEEKIPFEVLEEENLFPVPLKETRGWIVQQIIKLKMAEIVSSDYYLVLDYDHFLTKHLSASDLFISDGETLKVKYHFEPWQTENNENYSTNCAWWIQSSKILRNTHLPTQNLMSVTPQVLVAKFVKELISHLQEISVREKIDGWQLYLSKNEFTEFTLYWTFLLQTNKTSYYTPDNSLWTHDHEVNVLKTHCNANKVTKALTLQKTFFSVIQGYISQDVEPFIKAFNKFFSAENNKYDAVFLTASVVAPNRPQSYSVNERFQQTLGTLQSIKKKVPNSFCILIEGTNPALLNPLAKQFYEFYYDEVIYAYDSEIEVYTNKENIGNGEMKLLERGIDYILKNKIYSPLVIKLGARYTLTEDFNLSLFSKDLYTFKKKIDEHVGDVLITGLYGIPRKFLEEFKEILILGQNVLPERVPMIEKLFLALIEKEKLNFIEKLGLEGNLSYNKEHFVV